MEGSDPTQPPQIEDTTENWKTEPKMEQDKENAQQTPGSTPLLPTPGAASQGPDFDQQELKKHYDTVLATASREFVIRNFSNYKPHEPVKFDDNDSIELDGTVWSPLVFPAGDKGAGDFSVYIESDVRPASGKAFANVLFSIQGSKPEYRISKNINQCFSERLANFGYPKFATSEDLRRYGFIKEDDSITVRIDIELLAGRDFILFGNSADLDSKRNTGMVGLSNQGATCYMNSLLQALYHTPSLRRAVYQMPTETDDADTGVALALQRVFYRLQTKDIEVSTTELTKSFGWDTRDAFMQHDVQEFSRVLMDNLEEKMKNTPVNGTVKRLFAGRMKSYVRCINVDFESSREEDFYDIQLNVKDIRSLRDSFRDYINVETLEGDNQYMAEGHGMQDAKKGVIFLSFPPVLHLQLKRFEYSFMYDDYYKINDRFEFPEHIDLSEFLEEGSASPATFTLQAVLVHSGTTYGGHYTAYISPQADGSWYHFDDELVYQTPPDRAIEDNYGSPPTPYNRGGGGNAYMLVYVRDDVKNEVLKPMADDEVPAPLRQRFEEEEEEQRRLEEDRIFNANKIKFKLYSDELINEHVDADIVRVAPGIGVIDRLHESWTPRNLLSDLSEKYEKPQERLRLWFIRSVAKSRIQVLFRVPDEDLDKTWGQLFRERELRLTKDKGFSRLYVEYFSEEDEEHQRQLCDGVMDVRSDDEGGKGAPAMKEREEDESDDEAETEQDLLIFVKYFDINNGRLRHLKRLHICPNTKHSQIVDVCKPLLDLPPDCECLLFKEDHFDQERPEEMHIPQMPLESAALEENGNLGDIFIIQQKPDPEKSYTYPTVQDWFRKRCDEFVVKVARGKTGSGEHRVLTLNAMLSYSEIQQCIAREFGLEQPDNIRLFRRRDANYATAIPSTTQETLEDMTLASGGKLKFLNFFELSKPVQEIEQEMTLAVAWFDPERRRVEQLSKTVRKDASMQAIARAVAEEKGVAEDDMDWIRCVPVDAGRIVKARDDWTALDLHAHRVTPRVEVIPEDQRNVDPSGTIVEVRHFWQYALSTHSDPFLFVVYEDERVEDFCKRVKEYLRINDKEFEQWKPHVLAGHMAKQLEPEEKLSPSTMGPGDVLGFEHVEKHRFPRLGGEAAVKIHN